MATAHLICGRIGVGKTTLARRLEREAPAVRFSHDEWMTRLYGEDPPADRFAACHDRVSQVMDQIWPRCLALGVDVVLDLGFWTRAQRDRTRAEVVRAGALWRLYEVVCPEAEAWKRVEARNGALGGALLITRNTFDVLRGRFEPLSDDEERAVLDTSGA